MSISISDTIMKSITRSSFNNTSTNILKFFSINIVASMYIFRLKSLAKCIMVSISFLLEKSHIFIHEFFNFEGKNLQGFLMINLNDEKKNEI